MALLTKKKRKWIVNQFRSGRSPTQIASIQKVSRQTVYDLVAKHKREGVLAYETKQPGRKKMPINKRFVQKVVKIRNDDDYGSEKIHYVLKQEGFAVSQHIIQRVLDEQGLTDPCPKRRGQRTYVRYQWPMSNYMWHCDWSQYKGEWYCAFIDDRSRKIMAAAKFKEATTEHALFVLYQAILIHEVCPVVILSDKGAQFYANKYDKKGKKGFSQFEKTLDILGIDFWTARRGHPQTNGKMEKWFDTMKKRFKKHPDHTLQEFVQWYNEKRIHHALQYDTPDKVYYEKL